MSLRRVVSFNGLLGRAVAFPRILDGLTFDDDGVEAPPAPLPAPTLRRTGRVRLDEIGTNDSIELLQALRTPWGRVPSKLAPTTTRGAALLDLRIDWSVDLELHTCRNRFRPAVEEGGHPAGVAVSECG